VWLLRYAVGRSVSRSEVRFAVHVRNGNREGKPPLVRLKAVCGPGDDGGPVVTVMLAGEDQARPGRHDTGRGRARLNRPAAPGPGGYRRSRVARKIGGS
jgi:hypothetical protein